MKYVIPRKKTPGKGVFSENNLPGLIEQLDLPPLVVHGWVYIVIQRHLHAGMSENFTQRFDIHPSRDTARGKGMAQGVEIDRLDFVDGKILFKMVLIGARFQKFRASCQKKIVYVGPQRIAFQKLQNKTGKRNIPAGGNAFGRTTYHLRPGLALLRVYILDPLKGGIDSDKALVQIDIFPFRAQISPRRMPV